MGCIHQFVCPACGYSAEVSGGDDAGMESLTVSIVCHQCKELFDVQSGWTVRADTHKPVKIRCPRSAKHLFSNWNEGDGCPKCGATMENKGTTMLWD